MATVGSDLIGGVNGIEAEPPTPLTSRAIGRGSLIGATADDIALVFPLIGGRVSGLHHTDECPLVGHEAVVHTVQIIVDLAHHGSPIAHIGQFIHGSTPHTSEIGIHRVERPLGLVDHQGTTQILPVDEVERAASVEVAMTIVGIAIRSIGLIHIIISVGRFHHGGVMHVGEVPLAALVPSRNIGITIGIRGDTLIAYLIIIGKFLEQQVAGFVDTDTIYTAYAESTGSTVANMKAQRIEQLHIARFHDDTVNIGTTDHIYSLLGAIAVYIYLFGDILRYGKARHCTTQHSCHHSFHRTHSFAV